MVAPDPSDDLPPELAIMQAAAAALPLGQYVIYDPEVAKIPGGVYGLHRQLVAKWQGTDPTSMGYGDLQWLATSQGPGLLISMAGSQGQSASSVWVLPAQLEGWLA